MGALIQLADLHRIYENGGGIVHALQGISLTIHAGEFVAIMGSSGSGKSTLMNILGCLDRGWRGQYSLDGTDIASLKRDELARLRNAKLGFVFQGFNLLTRTTALENVELPMLCGGRRLPSSEIKKRAEESLMRVGLAERAGHFPNQLSGGQQQRVAIARALVNRPEVILADEPTGNLDTKTSIDIMRLLQELNDIGTTIVLVTHELDIARYCKRMLVIRDGSLVLDEEIAERLIATRERECTVLEYSKVQLTA